MGYPLDMRTALLLTLSLTTLIGAAADRYAAPAAPCTTATATCTAWVVFGSGLARTMVYSSCPLTARNDRIRRALIMMHGTNRNADHSFSTAVAAAFLAGALEDTIVIAPHVITASDPKQADEVVAARSPSGH